MENHEKERNKNYRSILFRSYPLRNRKFHKNSKKFEKGKKKKYDYGSFQAKIGRKKMRNMENKNYCFVSFLPDAQKKFPKKIKKLKNTIVDSFQAKIDWRRMRKRENKNYTSVTFESDT